MEALRIAVAGAGSIGRCHIAEIRRNPALRLCGLVDVSDAARALAAQENVPIFDRVETLLQAVRPHGVVIATPNRLHAPQALACIAAGVPVLVEKPLADTVADAERIVRAAEGAGVPLLVGHHRRHGPLLARAVEVVRSGVLGRIVAVMGCATFCKPAGYFEEGPWRRQPGGGPILLNMIHEVDDLRALVGEIVEVQACASNAVRAFPVEDTVAMTFRFDGGALGTFLLSDTAASPRSWEQTSGENPRYARDPDQDCYVISGDRGSLGVPTLTLHRYPASREASWFEPFERERLRVEPADPLTRQMAHFAAVLRGEAAPRVSGRDGLANLRITEAIVAAARDGRTVRVAPH